ncbi:hypothetical protein C8R45DRAFT_938258 [Mycena sanguinolenta]|nr:hypothetical protein C8R45DRAFT_938258 [Mycena sanguinolenta]
MYFSNIQLKELGLSHVTASISTPKMKSCQGHTAGLQDLDDPEARFDATVHWHLQRKCRACLHKLSPSAILTVQGWICELCDDEWFQSQPETDVQEQAELRIKFIHARAKFLEKEINQYVSAQFFAPGDGEEHCATCYRPFHGLEELKAVASQAWPGIQVCQRCDEVESSAVYAAHGVAGEVDNYQFELRFILRKRWKNNVCPECKLPLSEDSGVLTRKLEWGCGSCFLGA